MSGRSTRPRSDRLQTEYDRLQNRIHDAYVDKLDGRIDAAFFDRMSADWRRDQERCLRDIEQHQEADQSYLEEGVQLLELARNAQRLFAKQEAKEKRRLLGFLVSNCSWKGGELTAELRQPFDLLEQAVAAARIKKAAEPAFDSFTEIWLPGQDSNLRQGG
jgi:site-specific DNA recombinase